MLNSDEKWLSTNDFAEQLGVRPDTVRRSICVNGHYLGIKSVKLPNGRHLFPGSKINKLLETSAHQSHAA